MDSQTHIYSDWNRLIHDIISCRRCRLYSSRTNAVPGEGSRSSDILIVGEAPGRTEDEMGRPFVGAAGNLLTRILRDAGIDRGEVYITNVVKCRPPNNREPLEDEVNACSIYLISQFLLIKPKIVITLGNHAGKWFADHLNVRWAGITRMRGRVFEGEIMGHKVKIMPTYHPAAALRRPQILSYIETDIKAAINIVRGDSQKSQRPYRRSLLDFIGGSNPTDKN
jgi:DNA polymerase